MSLDCNCVGVHPFCQTAANGVNQSVVGVHFLEAFLQLFDASNSPLNSGWMLALEEVMCVFFFVTDGVFGR